MKKVSKMRPSLFVFLAAAVVAILVVASSASVSAAPASAPGPWKLDAPAPIIFECTNGQFPHTLQTIVIGEDNRFQGTGSYDPDPAVTWKITGQIEEDAITFEIVYTGKNAPYVLQGYGVISPDGAVSGTVDNTCFTFSMPRGSAYRSNHGRYVSAQEDKGQSAQDTTGIPGLTKP